MDDVPPAVSQNLNLDMMRMKDQLFQVQRAIPKGGKGFCLRALIGALDFGRIIGGTHPSAAASGSRLQQNRISDLTGDLRSLLPVLQNSVRTWNNGYSVFFHQRAGRLLVSHHPDHLRGRPDKQNSMFLTETGKIRILRKESITGVNRLALKGQGCLNNSLLIQIAFCSRGRTDADPFCGKLRRERVHVLGGTGQNRLYSHLLAAAENPHGNLSSVCNQNPLKHPFRTPQWSSAQH